MKNQLSTRLIPIMVFIIVSLSEVSLAQYDVSTNNYYQASHYISLHFNSKEDIDTRLNEFYQHRYYEPAWLKANGRLNDNAHDISIMTRSYLIKIL